MKIIPHLWYSNEAVEAAKWYTSLIENGKINWTHIIKDTPSGDAETVEFRLANLTVAAISAGDYFKLTALKMQNPYTINYLSTLKIFLWNYKKLSGTLPMQMLKINSEYYGKFQQRFRKL